MMIHSQSTDQKVPHLRAPGRGWRRSGPIGLSRSVSPAADCTNSKLTVECVVEQRREETRGDTRGEARRRRSRVSRDGKMIAQAGRKKSHLSYTPADHRAGSSCSALKPCSVTPPLGSSSKIILFSYICLTLFSLSAISRVPLKCVASAPSEAAAAASEASDVVNNNNNNNNAGELDNWVPSSREEAEVAGLEPGEYLSNEQMHLMSTRLPRQQFRIHVEPASPRKANPFKLIKIHTKGRTTTTNTKASTPTLGAAPKQAQNQGQSGKSAGTAAAGDNASKEGASGPASKSASKPATTEKGTGKKISSAALRKLLSQTLPKLDAMQNSYATKGAGSSSQSSPFSLSPSSLLDKTNSSQPGTKGPHFKFVFIQRATQAPASKGATKNKAKVLPVSPEPAFSLVEPSKTSQQATNGNGNKNQQQQPPSLAASVSKQLASSLFYSAANLVGNLTSPSSSLVPSLTALASLAARHHVAQTDSKDSRPTSDLVNVSSPTSTSKPSAASSGDRDSSDTASNDIRRLSDHNHHHDHHSKATATTKSAASAFSAFTSMSSSASTKTKPARKSRPSKIYNLPVKFVANGQANHVVFHTIKQHFATIKRLQQSVQSSANSNRGHVSSSSSSTGAMGKRKKFSGSAGQTGTRLKGKNSRLIYLPLKYLSNAKPSMLNVIVGGTKASHKSTTGALKSKN